MNNSLASQKQIGKTGIRQESNKSERMIKHLVMPYIVLGKNITTDNLFAFLPLIEQLLPWKLTIVRTLENNPYPRDLTPCTSHQTPKTLFVFRKNLTIRSYIPKKEKFITL